VPLISQQPKPMAEVFTPVRPNCRYSMVFPYFMAYAATPPRRGDGERFRDVYNVFATAG